MGVVWVAIVFWPVAVLIAYGGLAYFAGHRVAREGHRRVGLALAISPVLVLVGVFVFQRWQAHIDTVREDEARAILDDLLVGLPNQVERGGNGRVVCYDGTATTSHAGALAGVSNLPDDQVDAALDRLRTNLRDGGFEIVHDGREAEEFESDQIFLSGQRQDGNVAADIAASTDSINLTVTMDCRSRYAKDR